MALVFDTTINTIDYQKPTFYKQTNEKIYSFDLPIERLLTNNDLKTKKDNEKFINKRPRSITSYIPSKKRNNFV